MFKLPHWPLLNERMSIDLDLSRIKVLLKEIGNPHLKLPPVIHVAGTNGKGSTVAFCRAIFEQAGYKVHAYTSPHLVKFNERIKILGEDIEPGLLYEVIEECRIAAEKISLKTTFFEGTTCAAFLAFSRVPADIVVLETGLGGRLDATNVIDHPLMTIITSVSFDHMDYLGNTITQIAGEKAGIIKKNVPCVISQQYDEGFATLFQKAEQMNADILAFSYDWMVNKEQNKFIYHSKDVNLILPTPKLVGDHQLINAGNAITAALNCKDFNISHEAIGLALQSVKWPARLQHLTSGPIVDLTNANAEIWVDGAHNEAGAHVLSCWLEEKKLPTYLIYGTTKNRDCKAFLRMLEKHIKLVVAVPIDAEPLSYSAEYIEKEAKKLDLSTNKAETVEEALAVIAETTQEKCIILITGSLYLAGDVLYKNQKMRV